MKKLGTALILLCASILHAQSSGLAAPNGELMKPLGNLFTLPATFSTLPSQFVASGVTPTVVSNKLQFTGGANTFTQSYNLNYATTLPEWDLEMTYVVGTTSSSSNGIGLGIRSINNFSAFQNIVAWVDTTNTGAAGTINFAAVLNGTGTMGTATSSVTKVAFTAGDTIRLHVGRSYNQFIVWANDVTTASTPVYLFTQGVTQAQYLGTSNSFDMPNMGNFAVFNFGGTQQVATLTINSTVPVGAPVCVVGDSRTVGYSAQDYSQTWLNLLQSYIPVVNLSGGGDGTQDVINEMTEIKSLGCKNIVLAEIAGGDILNSVSSTVYEANYNTIMADLTPFSPVYSLIGMFTTGINQATFEAFVIANFPANRVFNLNMSQYGSGILNAADGLHMLSNGQFIEFEQMKQFLSQTGYSYYLPSYQTEALNREFQGIGITATKMLGPPVFQTGLTGNLGSTVLIPSGNLLQTQVPMNILVSCSANATAVTATPSVTYTVSFKDAAGTRTFTSASINLTTSSTIAVWSPINLPVNNTADVTVTTTLTGTATYNFTCAAYQ